MRRPATGAVLEVMTDAAEFAVRFHWPEDLGADDQVHVLEAATLPQAKMQAAMLYSGAAFKLTPPIGYVVSHQGR